MTFYGPQNCRLPKPAKDRPQQAPQIHSNDFLWASKLPFASLQRIQTSKIPNTFPNMHPRAKATSPTGTPGPGHSNGFLRLSKLPFASPQTLQNSPNPPNAPNPPKPAKPSKHRPQQAPQIHSNDFLDAFKAALTGGQGHSNDFLWASKLQFASLQRILGPRQLPQQAPQGQATAMAFLGFQSCRLPARKPSKTLQNSPNPPNPPNAPNPPKPAKPSKHRLPSRHLRSTAMTFLMLSKLP